MKYLFVHLALWAMTVSALFAQKKPEIQSFVGNKQVKKNEQNVLAWKVKNAEKVFLQNNNTLEKQEVNKEGNYSFVVEKDFSFTLMAINGTQSTEAHLKGKVIKLLPIIHNFGGSDSYYANINDNNRSLPYLNWRVSKAKYILLDNSPPIFDLDSTLYVKIDSTHRFTLTAIGEDGDTARAYHQIRLNTGTAIFGLSDGTKEMGLVANVQNKITWEFAGASWVIIKQRGDTLKAKGYVLAKPDTLDRKFRYDFLVKYPHERLPINYTYKDWVLNAKMIFRPSVLRSLPNKNVTLEWNTRSVKNIRLIVDDEVFENQPVSGSYTFLFEKETDVILEGIDQFGKEIKRKWRICNTKRPFLRNTISFDEIKKDEKIRRIAIDIFEVDRSEFPKQVKIKLLVTDTLGNFIRGLAPPSISETEAKRIFKEIIETSEHGKSHYITNFKVREINEKIAQPHDIALCLDHSGSIDKFLPHIQRATANLLNSKAEDDRFSIVRFSSDLITDTRVTQSSNGLVNVWNNRKPIYLSGTALYAGADTALDTFDSTSTNQKVLFLITDGQENSSFQFATQGKAFNIQQLATKARKLGVKIFPIALGTGVNEKLLTDLAWLTDGKLLQGYEAKDIEGIYDELTRCFHNYYEITYTPKYTQEGKHNVLLKYYNNRGNVAAETRFFMGDKFKIFENTGFVSARNTKVGKQPLIPKQAVAFFDMNKDNLKPTFTANLDAIADFLKKNTDTKADIVGHTDLAGADDKNLDLSKRRAETVQAYLVAKGIDKARLQIIAMGAKEPIWKREKEAWQAQENRRIEIVVWE